tara:strand:- start:3752 stop:3985 length:234 start_codon:yes stop_codon:yes gene_type:complete
MIKVKRGNKHPKDKIVFVNNHQMTYEELAKICVIFCTNEDNIYPPPQYKGGEMLIEFLNECMINRTVNKEILKKYNL